MKIIYMIFFKIDFNFNLIIYIKLVIDKVIKHLLCLVNYINIIFYIYVINYFKIIKIYKLKNI